MKDDAPFLSAQKQGTVGALNKFLSDFPGHKRETSARAEMEDLKAYNYAKSEDWYSEYERYIEKFPRGIHLLEAQKRLEWLRSQKADVEIQYPKLVDQNRNYTGSVQNWKWSTVFREKSGKIGYRIHGEGGIRDTTGRYWTYGGRSIGRGNFRDPIKVPPGGVEKDINSFTGSDHRLCNGVSYFTWIGEDAGGHSIQVEEEMLLRCKHCLRRSK